MSSPVSVPISKATDIIKKKLDNQFSNNNIKLLFEKVPPHDCEAWKEKADLDLDEKTDNDSVLNLKTLLNQKVFLSDDNYRIKRSRHFRVEFLEKYYPDTDDNPEVGADAHVPIKNEILNKRKRYMVFFYILNAYLENLNPSQEDSTDLEVSNIINKFFEYLYEDENFIAFVDGIAKRQEDVTDPSVRATFFAECLTQILTCVDGFEKNSQIFKQLEADFKTKKDQNSSLELQAFWKRAGTILKYAALPLVPTVFFSILYLVPFPGAGAVVASFFASSVLEKIFVLTYLASLTLYRGYAGNKKQTKQEEYSPDLFYRGLRDSRGNVEKATTSLNLYHQRVNDILKKNPTECDVLKDILKQGPAHK